MQDVAGWAIVISFVFGLSSMVFASWLASQRAEKTRVDALDNRVTQLEERSKHTPSVSQLSELTAEMRHMRSAIEDMRAGQRAAREEQREDMGLLNERLAKYEEAVLREASR